MASMRRGMQGWALLVLPLATLAADSAAAFDPGEIYWAPGDCISTCGLFDVTAGGDLQTASPLALIQRTPGQIAWDENLLAYVTQFDSDEVVRIDASGAVVLFATGIDGATGLLLASDGRMLAVSYNDDVVYDITGGGNFSEATPFAVGFMNPRNLLELATGEILLADQSRHAVYDISGGGDFASATPFASWVPSSSPYDLVQDAAGRIFASTDDGVFDITGGGDFAAAAPHATGRSFVGLAVDAHGRLLASDLDSGDVFDITAPGDYAGAAPFASRLDGFGDSALDRVPSPPSQPPPTIPGLGHIGGGLLASLIAAVGFVFESRRFRRVGRQVAERLETRALIVR
jgi:hypothetical protein